MQEGLACDARAPADAADAYRRAVEINPRDYRAWYGLGQAYELLRMPYYSLHYYRCAARNWASKA